MNSIKVLAIDGGGIRGIIPAIILAEFQKRLGRNLCEVFDLIAGTSTGGIIALGIGTKSNAGQPYSPDQLLDLYVQNGPAIFKKNLLTSLKEIIFPKYSPDALETILANFFQATEFKTALTPLLISSYDLHKQRPFIFKSHYIAAHPNYNWEVKSIARATSAAPTYFPPLHLTKGTEDYALADGGVFINNPAMAAYAEARSLYSPESDEFIVVSVGTGDRQDHIEYRKARKWGLLGWAPQIVPVFMDSVSEAVDYQLAFMPGCKYHRLQAPNLQAAEAQMDDVTPQNLDNLQSTARKFVAEHAAKMDEICEDLKSGRGSNMPGIGLAPQAGSEGQ
jgi:patatin-like phospholipase/acyl hydrolase